MVFVPRSLPLVRSYVQRSPGRHSGGDATDMRRSAGAGAAPRRSGTRGASVETHAALDSASTESTTRTRDAAPMKKSSHRWRADQKNRRGAPFPVAHEIESAPDGNEDRADECNKGADGKTSARESATDQGPPQEEESPRDVGKREYVQG